MPLRRDFFKRSLFLFLLLSFSSSVLSIEKYFDRNQLPQLSQEILDESQFSYSKEVVDRILIIPVQTQRVLGLRIAEKKWLLDDAYRPLVIDKDNYLIDGHHRLDGLTELKIEKVRVLRVSATIEEVIEAFEEYRDFTPTYEPEKE
tara:strand:- start:9 stop:446 length:438 start_codon:yes stop_codon:yes gene_type:complete